MPTLMQEFDWVRTYLDDLLVLSSNTFDDHLQKVEQVFNKLLKSVLKVHMKKCTFCAPEV